MKLSKRIFEAVGVTVVLLAFSAAESIANFLLA